MKKSLIDKVLLEWSYRCDDGIVDINNPKKRKILEEILGINILQEKEQIEIPFPTNYKEEIIDYVKSLNDKDLKNFYDKIKISKNKTQIKNNYETVLKSKGLGSLFKDIYYIAYDNEEVSELFNYLKSPTITLKDFEDNTNVFSLSRKTSLSESLIKDLLNKNASLGVSIGRGEIALVILIKDSKIYTKEGGDIQVQDKIIEIKASRTVDKTSSGAGMVSKERSIRSGKKNIEEFVTYYFNVLDDSQKSKIEKFTGSWLDKLKLLSIFLEQTDKLEDFKTKFNSLLSNTYKNLEIKNIKDFYKEEGSKILAKEIAISLAKEYMETHKNVCFINVDNGDYIFVNSVSVESLIKNNTLQISSFIEDTPRIYYAGK